MEEKQGTEPNEETEQGMEQKHLDGGGKGC